MEEISNKMEIEYVLNLCEKYWIVVNGSDYKFKTIGNWERKYVEGTGFSESVHEFIESTKIYKGSSFHHFVLVVVLFPNLTPYS